LEFREQVFSFSEIEQLRLALRYCEREARDIRRIEQTL
jgi:hypothetical protein